MRISGKPRRSEDWARLPLSLQRPSAVGRDSEDFQVSISCCRRSILSETSLRGAVFVLEGRKQGMPEGEVHRYDEEHYLASVPIPFRSVASAERPLLAIFVEFDMPLAAEIASEIERRSRRPRRKVSYPAGWNPISRTCCCVC
ncbi:hypothetical protein BN77_1658 [Rhizobium mesoamericanum STM3625]|uniref:Transcription regulator HTH AraC N-terminal domain-containing protein n=1 Tax=Rhizobium mesoamericanum STM3625 TaxID=1211777 RepID=K0PXF3_9HYPH|nr:hypothetical protein BN77_1658 [Rhizobium mesoamericanum STM3625]